MIADLISPSDARWRGLLDRVPHDVYHLPEYAAFSAVHEGGVPVAFHAAEGERELLLPLLVRPLPAPVEGPGDWHDAASPYGYPGPLATHPRDTAWIARSMEAFRELAHTKRLLTAFLRLHPFLGVPPETLSACGLDLHHHGWTVHVDVTRPPEQSWMRPTHRRGVRKLRDAGFSVTLDDWDRYEAFGPLYRDTMSLVNASSFYFFPDAYFRGLRQAVGSHLHLAAVLGPAGELAAAGLFTELGGLLQYHLGATDRVFRSRAPSKLMFDVVHQWAFTRGAAVLHLGGGLGCRDDSLLEFKAGFSRLRAPFHTARMIFDAPAYAAAAELAGRPEVSAGEEDFFPLYRARHAERTGAGV